MPSFLSAKAPTFSPRTQPSASNTEMPLIIACRDNEEIGVYKDGVLKPRKDVTSLIAWKEDTPFTTVAASAKDAQLTTVTPVPSASLDELAVFQSASPMAGPDAIGVSPNTTADGNSLKFHQGEVPTFGMVQPNAPVNHNYQPLSPQFQNFQQQILTNHQPAYYPATGLFQYPAYQLRLPSDIAVAEANRPLWNPAYHKVISPSVERANQVVEEFKLYFGDGRAPELLLLNLQKICVLCGLSDTNSLPESSEGCITILERFYINVFDLVEAGRAVEQGGSQRIQVPTFRTSKEFFDYCKQEGKICPRWIGKANPLFQSVMNRFRG